MKLQTIVFSKDRACQLDGLMRSIVDQFVGWDQEKWTAIFLATTPEFKRGYDIVRSKPYGRYYRMVEQINKSFKQFVIEAINPNIPNTMFLVDDDVFIRQWQITDPVIEALSNKEIITASLRMDHRYDYCYTEKRTVKIPTIKDGKWRWQGEQGDWGYPMSLDGHIFRTSEILDLIQKLDFGNPNNFEGVLATHPLNQPLMISYPKARLLNLPVNKVQTVNANHAGLTHGVTAKQLNDWYLQGKLLQVNRFYDVETANAPHYELPMVVQ